MAIWTLFFEISEWNLQHKLWNMAYSLFQEGNTSKSCKCPTNSCRLLNRTNIKNIGTLLVIATNITKSTDHIIVGLSAIKIRLNQNIFSNIWLGENNIFEIQRVHSIFG